MYGVKPDNWGKYDKPDNPDNPYLDPRPKCVENVRIYLLGALAIIIVFLILWIMCL